VYLIKIINRAIKAMKNNPSPALVALQNVAPIRFSARDELLVAKKY